jgi:hypothetical protein
VSTTATLLGYGTWAFTGRTGRLAPGKPARHGGQTGGGRLTHADHTGVVNHTHNVSVTDPGHSHLTQRYPSATGGSTGFTVDLSQSGVLADNTLPVKSATTGVTAGTANPAGGVAALAHDSPSHLPPYVVVFMWSRTA